jgi:hypothetical protein
LDRELDQLKVNQGLLISRAYLGVQSEELANYEFKVFSQWGEDGIIQHLIRSVPIANPTFIEFGVEDFSESNCRFLLMKDYWEGYVIDGSSRNIARLQNSYYFWKYRIRARAAFVTRENIDQLLAESGFDRDLGLLSVDIDGMDYHVLERIQAYRPRILIAEYNAVFGKDRAVSVPYRPDFQRTVAHYSNLDYGESLRAFDYLASSRGYTLVGVNSAGSNAFFIRCDVMPNNLKSRTVDECFGDACFREGGDKTGRLSLPSGADRRRVISKPPVVDVVTGAERTVGGIESAGAWPHDN